MFRAYAGTAGNDTAGDYIIKRYKEIGLIPLEKDNTLPNLKDMGSHDLDHIKLEIINDEL